MDEAQSDRFQVRVKIPYRPDVEWFRQTYGQRMADSAINWWDELDEDNKRQVSPRRLQYALDCAVVKGDLHDILPPSCNVSKLIATLKDGPITDKLQELLATNSEELVSSDFNHNPASSTFDLTQTQVIDGGLVRVLSWYDNEWGFSNRMSDTAVAMGKLI